jgi:hypothetical protein
MGRARQWTERQQRRAANIEEALAYELRALQAQGWHASATASPKLAKLVKQRSEAVEQQDFAEFVLVSVKILQIAKADAKDTKLLDAEPSENGRG